MKFILGKKLEMTQIFTEDGTVVPVTLIEAGPCQVLQLKDEKVQIGFDPKKKKFKHSKEFKGGKDMKVGDKIDVSVFEVGDKVKISGISKGKGFQGGVKRWGFSGRGASHGVKHEARTLGSTGSAFPQRVIKGRKMPGRTGSERITIKNLEVVKVDKDNNVLAIRGAVPGRKGTLLEIRG